MFEFAIGRSQSFYSGAWGLNTMFTLFQSFGDLAFIKYVKNLKIK